MLFNDQILSSVRGPVVLFLVVSGLFLGFLTLTKLTHPTYDTLNGLDEWTLKIWFFVFIAEMSYQALHLLQDLLDWYAENIAARTYVNWDDTLIPPIKRVLPLTIYAFGGLIALNGLGVSISPLLAGLGIGGLAIALAVQPTLGNFFSGTYLITQRELNPGAYIEIDKGPSGYVADVGWRSTKMRTMFNTLVVIPNSKMASSVVTNYYSPSPAMYVMLTWGVSYENDLAHVEQIVIDEIQQLVDESPHAVKDYAPWFGWDKFGETNVEFWIYYQAVNHIGTFHLISDGIERLHSRFQKEKIKRNYPMREMVGFASDGHLDHGELQGSHSPQHAFSD